MLTSSQSGYYNDTQEIDMEFLTKDFNPSNNSFPVNLILQSTASKAAGYNAAHSGNMITSYLPFNPTVDFHEYRIDYLSDRVFFYADGQQLALLDTSAVPTKAGRLILQHWSNGNPLWSSGPPQTDSVLMVRYVKAYFNSTHGRRGGNGEGTVCQIPEMTPGNKTAAGWFFSGHANMTNNQTVWGKSGGHRLDWSWSLSLMICLGMSGWLSGLW
jgi:beta-glucanase (GH16 family)